MAKYSVVFMPNLQTINAIKQMKLLLANKIGWFNSKNSLAHFTIFEFEESEANEETFCLQLERIAAHIKPFYTICNAFDWFDNGAFYIKPNQNSAEHFTFLMKQIIKESNQIKKTITNTNAHMSIARKLSPENLQIAQQLFTQVQFEFEISHLTLRKFNETEKQFKILKEFPFLSKPKEIQGSLF